MNTKVIVSLTSHTKERMKNLPYFLFHSIIKHNLNYVKIVLTLAQDDIQNIPPDLQAMIDNGLVELIIAEQDLKCNLKYFYCMKKYRDLPIITIDDDSVYPKQMIPDLLALYEKYPDVIIARSARLIEKGKSYRYWHETAMGVTDVTFNHGLTNQVRTDLNPEGYGGILYPPNILKVSDDMIPEIMDFPRADDIYLTVIEQRKGIKVLAPIYNYKKLDICTRPAFSICTQGDNIQMIDNLVKRYL